MKSFNLKIVTPEKEIFSDQVVSVIVPGAAGSFGILANHAPLVSHIKKGIVEIKRSHGKEIVIEVEEGYAKVKNNEMILLVTSAEMEAEIPDLSQ